MTTHSLTPKFPHVEVQLTGEDGNAFAIIGRVSKALKRAGESEGAADFQTTAFACESYDALLQLAMRTVTVH